jgi:hypothetical protein
VTAGGYNAAMKRRTIFLVLALGALATVARSGHELPVYPSYYPHEIQIERMAPNRAATLLTEGKLHAYVGGVPHFPGAPPESIRTVESLGALIVMRVNPQSPLGAAPAASCAVAATVLRDLAGKGEGFVFHPYPITPFHGDYLYHVDRAATAKATLLARATGEPAAAADRPKVKAKGELALRLVRPEWRADGPDWDVALEAVGAADLFAASTHATNGWLAPRWVRSGWFQAYLLLAEAASIPDNVRDEAERLQAIDPDDAIARINRERDLVARLTDGCRATVAGYTVKREYFSDEFSAGIENVAYDAIAGLSSPMFIRTVKLKDFPWNGWLALGIAGAPDAAWNPIAGFTDTFGRLTWYAVGDPAAIPSPSNSGWVLNRVSGVETSPRR